MRFQIYMVLLKILVPFGCSSWENIQTWNTFLTFFGGANNQNNKLHQVKAEEWSDRNVVLTTQNCFLVGTFFGLHLVWAIFTIQILTLALINSIHARNYCIQNCSGFNWWMNYWLLNKLEQTPTIWVMEIPGLHYEMNRR